MTKEIALPESVSPATWNADTAAMMEFAGLTWTENGANGPKRMYAPSGIMAAFINACRITGLDPTAKQIYAAIMGGKWTVLVGIDGMRVVAQRSGEYDGQDPIQWQAEENGPWTDVPPSKPFAARVAIYRKGVSRPLVQTVTFAEFGGNGNNWTKRPSHMLGIRAESHAFRRAFPMQLAGLYTAEDFEDGTAEVTDPEPTEDWAALIAGAESRADLDAIGARLAEKGEGTEKLRLAWAARAGVLDREANTVDAEVVEEPADYEAEASAEYDAAVERGEAQGD